MAHCVYGIVRINDVEKKKMQGPLSFCRTYTMCLEKSKSIGSHL